MKSNTKKLIWVALAAGLGMWIVAGIWHNLILPALYKQMHATHEGFGLLLVAYFILALFMAYLYPFYTIQKKPIVRGILFGMVIGLLWVFPHDLALAGAHNTSMMYVMKNSLWHMVEQGIGGIIVALIYGRNK